jgi:3-phenylpropionate/cinnamic acid dioxygenase small subunit
VSESPTISATPGIARDETLRSRVEGLLIHEANLLDERRYEDWLALFDPDALYWAPVNPLVGSPAEGLSHVAEDLVFLTARVRRLTEPTAYSEQPIPRMCRMVGNLAIEADGAPDGLVTVRSKLLVHEYRVRTGGEDEARSFAATVRHLLRAQGQCFKIVRKRVDLINSDAGFFGTASPL